MSNEVQVVFRQTEYCERCGAKNPFRKDRTITDENGQKMQYARCKRCGASAKIYWNDAD